MLLSSLLTSLVAICTTVQGAAIGADHELVKRASLTQVTNFGSNPSNIKMFIYVPQKLQAKPPVVLVLHACAWTANNFFATTKYGQLADQHGYVLIYGQTPTDGACWDVSSKESLTHDGGSDSTGLANMVRYALKKYNGDASKVYVTGESSGAMMTVSSHHPIHTVLIPLANIVNSKSCQPSILTSSPPPQNSAVNQPDVSTPAPSAAGTPNALAAKRTSHQQSGRAKSKPCTLGTQDSIRGCKFSTATSTRRSTLLASTRASRSGREFLDIRGTRRKRRTITQVLS
jgi:poly(3-hydroxybutyrate) depolymerase